MEQRPIKSVPLRIRHRGDLQRRPIRPSCQPPRLDPAVRVRPIGAQFLTRSIRLDSEEIGASIPVHIPRRHRAQPIGGTRGHIQRQAIQHPGTEARPSMRPADYRLSPLQRPDRQRRISRQRLALGFRDEKFVPAVVVHVDQAVQVVLWEIVPRLTADRIQHHDVPLAVTLIIVHAVHHFDPSIVIHIDQRPGFGPHHLGRLRRIGLDLAQPAQRKLHPVVVDDFGVHAEVGHHAEFGKRVIVDISRPEPAVVAVPVVAQLHLGRARTPVEHEDAVVRGHHQIELAVGIGVDHQHIGVPGIVEQLRLPHHSGFACIICEQPSPLGLCSPVAERILHLKALQPLHLGKNPGDLEDIVDRHGHPLAVARHIENLGADSPRLSV